MKNNTLIVVGCGIKFMSHLTTEAKATIEKSDKVLYLVNEPAMEEWLQKANPTSEPLDQYYTKNQNRKDNYSVISRYIIDALKKHRILCVVMYGHPTVFVQPTIDAASIAKREGYNVVIMPGISAEDCLFADLLIDPGTFGCQSFEATDFLLNKRKYDARSHLIIWQPYVIGLLSRPINHNPRKGLEILVEYLNETYSAAHEIVIYESAQYPMFKPRIERVELKNLPVSNVSRLSTLYISPIEQNIPNVNMIEKIKNILQ